MEIQPTENNGTFVKADDWTAVTVEGKIQKQITFQLQDENKPESISIWNNKEKKYYREGDKLVDKDGDEHDFKVIFYTGKDKLIEAFPGEPDKDGKPTTYLQKSTKYNWNVIIKQTEMVLGLGKLATEELEKVMRTAKSFGKDPLEMTYKVVKQGEGLNTKYFVELVTDPIPADVQAVADSIVPPVKKEEPFTPTDKEKEFVKAFREHKFKDDSGEPLPLTPNNLIIEYVKAGGTQDRAKALFTEYVQKQ